MRRQFTFRYIVFGGMLGILYSCSLFQNNPPRFEAQAVKESDMVEVKNDAALTTFDIFSPGGIGSATIHLTSGKLPRKILLRLHLKGLEEFRFSAGGKTILLSVSSTGENRVRQNLRKENGQSEEWHIMDADSPYWMEMNIKSANSGEGGKISVEEGYFEIEVPEYFLKKEISGFSLRWIDFYRE
jgi:hypothetical protein